MKNIFFIVLLFSIFSCSSDLEKITKYYKNRNLKEVYYLDEHKNAQGKDIKYYKSGKIKEINNYIKGNLQGLACNFYENGQLEIKSKYNANILIDTFYQFFPNGNLEAKVIYDKNGNKIKEIFFYPNGSLNTIRDYFVGYEELNAIKVFYENGKLNKEESNFIQIQDLGNNEIKLKLIEKSPFDTIYVKTIESFYDKDKKFPKVIRELKFTNENDVKIKLYESDYVRSKINVIFTKQKWFLIPEETPLGPINSRARGSKLQLTKGQKIPKDNLIGIYRKY